jgi:hypothetical protein
MPRSCQKNWKGIREKTYPGSRGQKAPDPVPRSATLGVTVRSQQKITISAEAEVGTLHMYKLIPPLIIHETVPLHHCK